MSEVYMGQIRAFAFAYPPKGWALCNGQILPIAQNQALFSLLGTFYGGNGQSTFALPDLRGRVSVHSGYSNGAFSMGQRGGEEFHQLTTAELPSHVHPITAAARATSSDPTGKLLASPGKSAFSTVHSTTLHPETIGATGGSQPHENRPPFTVLSYCIALVGIFPSRD
jgi:microcystin-dependent protein